MGRRGPPPKPKALLHSWRANLNRREPQAPPGRPICPAWIPKDAKQVWRAVVPLLEEMRVLTRADRESLTRYCVTFARWRTGERWLAENEWTIEAFDQAGNRIVKPHPMVRIVDSLATQLGKLEQVFGLTPSSRARIETAESDEGKTEAGKASLITFGKAARGA